MSAPAMVRYSLTVQYDGAPFHGWQIQKGLPTVQGEVESVLERITGDRRPVTGSGRTDRGVHALGQVAAVSVPASWSALRLHTSLNALLPPQIRVSEVRPVPDSFHPRYDATARRYEYRIGLGPDAGSPFMSRWCWDVSDAPPDPGLLTEAAALIPGVRDFTRFARASQPERGTRCRVLSAGWEGGPGSLLHFSITADRFLHHMVRYLVGTMVAVARRERPLEEMREMLQTPEVSLVTSPPAPPEGLFLTRVDYPREDDAPERSGGFADPDPLPGETHAS